jgi:hypothetical protein
MELAELTCEIFGLDSRKLRIGEPPEEALFPSGVPIDSSLSNRETKKRLQLGPASLEDLLNSFKVEWETGNVAPLTKRLVR